ncbi:phytoene/squalene synthase family protein [bacterium]|nr:phytoene/squalene synthase family protein [bacterium]
MSPERLLCYRYSREILKVYSKSFYLSTMLLPREKRDAVYALYGFCRFADNLVDTPRDRSPDELRNEIDALETELKIGYRTGESEQPALCAFLHAALEHGIPIGHPVELLEGVKMDIEHHHYQSFDELHLFCHRVAGVVGLMMTRVLGYLSEEAFIYAARLGIAMQLTNILRDIQEDRWNGRIYLPLDEMTAYGVDPKDLEAERCTPALRNLVRFSAERAHRYYNEAAPGIHLLTPRTRFAIQSASDIYRNILFKIEKNDFNPFLGRVYVPHNAKIRIILLNYLRGLSGKFKKDPALHTIHTGDQEIPS